MAFWSPTCIWSSTDDTWFDGGHIPVHAGDTVEPYSVYDPTLLQTPSVSRSYLSGTWRDGGGLAEKDFALKRGSVGTVLLLATGSTTSSDRIEGQRKSGGTEPPFTVVAETIEARRDKRPDEGATMASGGFAGRRVRRRG